MYPHQCGSVPQRRFSYTRSKASSWRISRRGFWPWSRPPKKRRKRDRLAVPIQIARSRIERRLRALEAVLIDDASHAVPHTRRWLLYWTEVIGKLMTGELDRTTLPGLI